MDRDKDDLVAGLLGLTGQDVGTMLGVGWTEATDEVTEDGLAWYLVGAPPQLMLALGLGGEVLLARPRGHRDDAGHLRYGPEDVTEVDPTDRDGLAGVRADLLRRRRSEFRYCAHCLTLTAPEGRSTPDRCHDCETRLFGVAHQRP